MKQAKSFGFSRREFLRTSTLLSSGVLLGGVVFSNDSFVSAVEHNPPVSFPHFPSRLHAFVWRNWDLVPVDRLASVLKCSTDEVLKLGQAMGLEKAKPITEMQWARSYITIIRRNWHLIPQSQLEKLLGWTTEHFEFSLQEDDFLYVKLGNLKPDVPELVWPNELPEDSGKWIKNVINGEFSEVDSSKREHLFQFVEELDKAPENKTAYSGSNSFSPQFGYGYFTLFGDPLLDGGPEPFSEGYLDRMAAAGLDGTWMHIVLNKLTPFPWNPAISKDWQSRLANLRKLVEKCRQRNIGIYLYLNEPRYQPLSFFEKHPDLKGVTNGEYAALCTSHPDVQQYLENSVAHIVSEVPDIAGFFTITASENRTHCWSHGDGDKCPKCASRSPHEVIAELHHIYKRGIQRGLEIHRKNIGVSSKTEPQLILWDWAWPDGWAEKIIPKLPKGLSYMCVSEWSQPIERGGIKGTVGEYSISAIGPGPRAKKHWAIAKEHGLRIMAKIQAGTTWECGGVPYIPALENVAQHIVNLRDEKVNGLLTGWTLGGYPDSPNLEVVSVIGGSSTITVREAMTQVANRRYGPAAGPMVEAWYRFSEAFREFPFHIGVVYRSPHHSGPANLLWEVPTGYASTMVGVGYDDLAAWRSIYPEEVFIEQLYKVADGFDYSLEKLYDDVSAIDLTPDQNREFENETRIAEAVAILYRSVANQAEIIRYRDGLNKNGNRSVIKGRLKELLLDEIKLARRLYELQTTDSRIGFEASNHYFYIPADLKEKVLNCRYLLDQWVKRI